MSSQAVTTDDLDRLHDECHLSTFNISHLAKGSWKSDLPARASLRPNRTVTFIIVFVPPDPSLLLQMAYDECLETAETYHLWCPEIYESSTNSKPQGCLTPCNTHMELGLIATIINFILKYIGRWIIGLSSFTTFFKSCNYTWRIVSFSTKQQW